MGLVGKRVKNNGDDMKTIADHLQDAHDEIKRLEQELLDMPGHEYFRCRECGKVLADVYRDRVLTDREIECCEDCAPTVKRGIADAAEQDAFETYLYNNR